MTREHDKGTAAQDKLERTSEAQPADEGAKPSDIGALDGAAAAGSAGAVSDNDDGGFSTDAPDPSIGPD